MDDAVEHARLTKCVSEKLSLRRIRAEHELQDANRVLERAQERQTRAVRDTEDIQAAIANPRRFLELAGEFLVSLQGGAESLDAFLATEEDKGLRRLLLTIRVDTEFSAQQAQRKGEGGG